MSGHGCPAPGCTKTVPREQLACRRHWYAIPRPLRDAVWTEYQRGPQSTAHMAAVNAAIRSLRRLP